MYARINLNSGCTLQQLRDDLVGLLTGTITSAAGLTSSNTSTSEVVNTLAAEWTFVQHITDTSTRCHFVLSGVDDGGVAKTLGVVLTNTSGTLAILTWSCGAWDSVNKRPAAIDVTGWLLSSYSAVSDFAAGSVKNGICTHHGSSQMTNIGIFNTGALQLQVTSEQGVTGIYSHYSSTHLTILEIVDIERDYWPEWAPAKWPFLAINVHAPGQGTSALSNACSGPSIIGLTTNSTQNGLVYGPQSWTTLPSPLSTELHSSVRYWGATNYAGGGQYHNMDYMRDINIGTTLISWWPSKAGSQTYTPRLLGMVPRTMYAPVPFIPIKHRIPGRIIPVGSSAAQNMAYLDEITAGADTYVAVGNGNACVYKG